jgi:hypothetical protein
MPLSPVNVGVEKKKKKKKKKKISFLCFDRDVSFADLLYEYNPSLNSAYSHSHSPPQARNTAPT